VCIYRIYERYSICECLFCRAVAAKDMILLCIPYHIYKCCCCRRRLQNRKDPRSRGHVEFLSGKNSDDGIYIITTTEMALYIVFAILRISRPYYSPIPAAIQSLPRHAVRVYDGILYALAISLRYIPYTV